MTSEPSVLFMTFQGEFVNILLSTNLSTTQQVDDEIMSAEIPLSVEGFLVDEDDQFLYIGPSPALADKAVGKQHVLLIQLKQPDDALQNALDEMEPEGSIN